MEIKLCWGVLDLFGRILRISIEMAAFSAAFSIAKSGHFNANRTVAECLCFWQAVVLSMLVNNRQLGEQLLHAWPRRAQNFQNNTHHVRNEMKTTQQNK